MSLHAAAQHLASRGRDEDSLLVHMTPKEVHGLQALAMSHGGSLTVNPDTGLPEAGFLKNILPTLIGLGANFFLPGIGMAGAAALGAGAGALTNKQNPLMGALMGGIGAYGGASLGAGLSSAGASAAANAVPAATQTAAGAAGAGAPSTFSLAAPTSIMPSAAAPGAAGFAVPDISAATGAFTTPSLSTAANASAMPSNLVAQEAAKNRFAQQAAADRLSQGFGAAVKNPSEFMQGMGGASGLIKTGAMAAAPVLMAPPEPLKPEEDGEVYRYRYDPGYTGGVQTPGSDFSSERRYFNPTYTRYAGGGHVTNPLQAQEYAQAQDPEQTQFSGLAPGRVATPIPKGLAPAITSARNAVANAMSKFSQGPAQPPVMQGITRLIRPVSPVPLPDQNQANYQYLMGQQPEAAPGMSPQNNANYQYLMGQAPRQAPRQAPALTLDQMVSQYRAANPPPPEPAPAAVPTPEIRGNEFDNGGGQKAGGGLKSGGFVIPADVVSALGNGSSSAGLELLSEKMGATAFHGPGDGMSDSIPTTIEGKQKARVAREEAYLSPEQVQQAGGTKKLYAMLDRIRTNAHGKTSQQRQINPNAVLRG